MTNTQCCKQLGHRTWCIIASEERPYFDKTASKCSISNSFNVTNYIRNSSYRKIISPKGPLYSHTTHLLRPTLLCPLWKLCLSLCLRASESVCRIHDAAWTVLYCTVRLFYCIRRPPLHSIVLRSLGALHVRSINMTVWIERESSNRVMSNLFAGQGLAVRCFGCWNTPPPEIKCKI